MKNYIFLSYAITNIGGAQVYLRNKLLYLRKRGWNVFIFTYQDGELIISELKEYSKFIIEEIEFPIYFFSINRRNKIIKNIVKIVNNNLETIIESNSIGLATWGEEIAKQLNVKHFIYLLEEHPVLQSHLYNFINFKHIRKEIAGIQSNTINNLFNKYKIINESESYNLRAFCTNVVEDTEHFILNHIKKSDYNIGSIGRLDKPYLMEIIDDIIKYIDCHSSNTFNLIFIGGSPNKKKYEKKILKKFKNVKNVQVFITGYTYPIPIKMIEIMDAFISSAGSASISYNIGIPTITIDTKNFKPLGILGYNTDSIIYRDDNTKDYEISYLLDLILFHKIQTNHIKISPNTQIDYSSHIEAIVNSENNLDFFILPVSINNLKIRVSKLFLLVSNIKTYKYLIKFLNTIKKMKK